MTLQRTDLILEIYKQFSKGTAASLEKNYQQGLSVRKHLSVLPSPTPKSVRSSYHTPRWHPPSEAGRVKREPEEDSAESKSHGKVQKALHAVFPVKDDHIKQMPHLPTGERAHYGGFTPGFGMKRLKGENPHRQSGPRTMLGDRVKREWHAHVKNGHKNVHNIVTRVSKAMADPHHPVTKQWLDGKKLGKSGRQLRSKGSLLDHHLKYEADSVETQVQLNVTPGRKGSRNQARKHLTHAVDRLRYEHGTDLHGIGQEHEARHHGKVVALAASRNYAGTSLFERVGQVT